MTDRRLYAREINAHVHDQAMDAASEPAFTLADLAKDCTDSLRRAGAVTEGSSSALVDERHRIEYILTPKRADVVCPPVFRHGGDEADCVCAWCGRQRPLFRVQRLPFLSGRFLAACSECSVAGEFVAQKPIATGKRRGRHHEGT